MGLRLGEGMNVHVQVFSFLREYLPAGSSSRGELDLELPEGACLKDLFLALGLDRRLGQGIFTAEVNNTFQVMVNNLAVNEFDHPLEEGDAVVMFPPMAGG